MVNHVLVNLKCLEEDETIREHENVSLVKDIGEEAVVCAVGFVTSNPENRLFTKVLNKGDCFLFPEGLVHFQFNVGKTNVVAIAALSSQDPGVITIANAVFRSSPPISPDVLTRAFQVDKKMANIHYFTLTIAILALASSLAYASDPSPLQDFCVALNDSKTAMFVNGKFCKNPKLATVDDFFFSGLRNARNTSNPIGSAVTQENVAQIPGLNTLGISLVCIDYAPNGLNPSHTYPRATEALIVLDGTLFVGFVTSNPENRLFTKVLNKGDVFVFPEGLIHFQFNVGKTNAVAIAALSSQNLGLITIANIVFGSNSPISPDVLAKAFQVDKNVIDHL
ncbi:hypothetical protein LguiB_032177 [Lonicera macranthoides]